MAGPGPWSVKGIDDATRAIAREAAERAGLPIGVWLDRAILKAESRSALEEAPAVADPGTTTIPTTEQTASAAGESAAPVDDPTPAAVPETRLLPLPPKERSPVVPSTISPGRDEVWKYAVAGAAALLTVVGAVTLIDRLAFPTPNETSPPAVAAAPVRPVSHVEVGDSGPADAGIDGSRKVSEADKHPEADPSSAAATRIDRLMAEAETGDAEAQLELGLSYIVGSGVPRDETRAARWLEKAAAQGLAPAQFNLAVLYERGRGVERDVQRAFSLYRAAAEQGYTSAQHNLATLYATGSGTAQNYAEAAKWFSRAAASGNAQSLYSLGLMHEHGLGMPRDLATARSFYKRAADRGSADGVSKLAALGEAPAGGSLDAAAHSAKAAASAEPAAGPPREAVMSRQPLDRSQTAELQRLLARLDFAPGPADGVAGRRTIAAIRLYQEFAGLPVDGMPTVGLLEDVRQVAGAISEKPRTGGR